MSTIELEEVIRAHDVPVSPAGLSEAIVAKDLLDARLAVAAGEFDALHLGDEDCGLNTRSWLRHKAKVDDKSAGRLVALGKRLHRFPHLRAAALEGRLSGGQLAIVTACVPERHFALFAEHEEVVIATLEPLGIDGTKILMRSWLARADALDEANARTEKPNEAFLANTLDGRGEFRASTDADRTARLDAALRAAETKDPEKSKPERRADAFDDIVRFYLDHHEHPSGRRNRPHVNVVMTFEEFLAGRGGSYADTGAPVSRAEAEMFRCDADLHRVLVDGDGAILDYGRATRQWPPDLYQAIALRDGGCRFDGCDEPAHRCDVHHPREWDRDDGETSFWNGFLDCPRHHHLIHALGIHTKLLPDGTVEFTWPDGRTVTTQPRGPISPHLWDQRRRRTDGS